ncbi:MAG: tetratricopeptide repeat protein [Phycisphaerales bacterium]|nr:tetratricopeptide repeat protein [Phycisphaerales bacterium]
MILIVIAVAPFWSACQSPVSVERQKAAEKWGQVRADVTCRLAEQALRNGSLDDARAKLETVLQTAPQHETARLLLVRVLIEQGEMDAAVTVLKSFDAADPPNPAAAYLMGVVAEMDQRYADAAGHYVTAARTVPTHLPYVVAAVEAMLSGEDARGARRFLASIKPPESPTSEWHGLLAEVAREENDYAAAIVEYERALTMVSSSAPERVSELQWRLATAYQAAGQFGDAVRMLEQILADDDAENRSGALDQIVRCHLALNDVDGAVRAVDRMEPDGPAAAESRLLVARDLIEASDYAFAGRQIDAVLTIHPDHADALMLKTLCGIRNGDRPAAESALRRWQSSHPDDPMIAAMRFSTSNSSRTADD